MNEIMLNSTKVKILTDNARLVKWDDQWLKANTPISLIDSVYGVYDGKFNRIGLFEGVRTWGQSKPIRNSPKKCEYTCNQFYKPVLIRKDGERLITCVRGNYDFVNNGELNYNGRSIYKFNPEYDTNSSPMGFWVPRVSYDNKTKITEILYDAFRQYGTRINDSGAVVFDANDVDGSKPDAYAETPDRRKKSFKRIDWFHSIMIPNSIVYIGSFAFSNYSVQTLRFEPNSRIEHIGAEAFSHLWLTDIYEWESSNGSDGEWNKFDLPLSLKTIWKWAFANNKLSGHLDLKSYRENLTKIEDGVFANNNITSVSLGKNIDYIGDRAFANNPISSIDFDQANRDHCLVGAAFLESKPNGVRTDNNYISVYPFKSIPNAVKNIGCWPRHIGSKAFVNNAGIRPLKLPWEIINIGTGWPREIWRDAFKPKNWDYNSASYPTVKVGTWAISRWGSTWNRRFSDVWCSPLGTRASNDNYCNPVYDNHFLDPLHAIWLTATYN